MMRGSMMKLITRHKQPWLAFALGMLAIFFYAATTRAQGVKDLPAPPPPWKAKPTPTPKPAEPEVIDVIKTNSNLVMVPVSVTSTVDGSAVQGLQPADFRLEEEGKKKDIAEIGNPEQIPLDIAILFDISSSVSQKGFFAFQQKSAAAFLKEVMKPNDRAAVFTIAMEPKMVQALAPAETAAAKILTIPAATSSVPTAFYDTVMAAARYLNENSPERHRRVIVVLSDGDDNFSERIRDLSLAEVRATESSPKAALVGLQDDRHRKAIAEVQQTVLKSDVTFYSVNPGGRSVALNVSATRAQNGMNTVANATGGSAFLPDTDQDLEKVFRQVASELRGQYLLMYYAEADAPAGQFRRINVSVPARQLLKVRARQGYYSKKQP
jgi:Ca-activated chloride channel family protein